VNNEEGKIVIELTKKQIEDSPSLDSDKPVSRQFEGAYYGYYGWPVYWSGTYMWGDYPNIVRDREKKKMETNCRGEKSWDQFCAARSCECYAIHATDGEIGMSKIF